MPTKNTPSLLDLQDALYEAVSILKALNTGLRPVYEQGVHADEANGFIHIFYEVIDRLDEIKDDIGNLQEAQEAHVSLAKVINFN